MLFTMVKLILETAVKVSLVIALSATALAQTDADRERRLADLERKLRQLDPSFAVPVTDSVDARLSAQE